MTHFVKIFSNHDISTLDLQKINTVLSDYGKVKYVERKNKDKDNNYTFIMNTSFDENTMEEIVEKIFKVDENIYVENSLPSASITKEDFEQMVYELSKFIHNSNVRKKVEAGWRYGETFDVNEKTSPLIKDFDSLEDKYKELRPDILKKVMEMIKARK